MRQDLPGIIALGRSLGFSFIQLNTNGLRLAEDPDYARALKEDGLATVLHGITLRSMAQLGSEDRVCWASGFALNALDL